MNNLIAGVSDDLISQGVTFLLPYAAGFLSALVVVALVGRAPAIILAPIARLLRLPLRVLRFFARLIRRSPEAAMARGAVAGAKAELDRGLEHLTDTDAALRVNTPPPGEGGPDAEEPSPLYDFSVEEKLMKRDGVLFRSIRIPDSFIPSNITMKLTDAVAEGFVREAGLFFNTHVPLRVNERSLYEDAENGVIVSLFRESDRRCFYALNELRKTINGNIRMLMLLFCLILIGSSAGLVAVFAGRTTSTLSGILLPAGVAVFAVMCVMYLVQTAMYQKQQEHSARELGLFLSRWLDRLSFRFQEATAHAIGVTVGEEKDTEKIANDARKWHKIMMWMAFRSFFIESFYRNIRFQMDRNRSYYDAVPAIVVVLCVGALIWAYLSPGLRPGDSTAAAVFAFLFVILVTVNLRLYYKTVIVKELDHSTWLGFENLQVSKAMDDVVGKYGEEVGYWKNRLGGV